MLIAPILPHGFPYQVKKTTDYYYTISLSTCSLPISIFSMTSPFTYTTAACPHTTTYHLHSLSSPLAKLFLFLTNVTAASTTGNTLTSSPAPA